MAVQYLGEDIQPYEKELKKVVMRARGRAKRDFPDWSLADKENDKTPGVKGSAWGFDMWVPRAYLKYASRKLPEKEVQKLKSVCADYANTDSLTTLYLWLEMELQIRERGLWKVFLERMKLPAVAMELEMPMFKDQIRGTTVNGGRVEDMIQEYSQDSRDRATICQNIARSLDYVLEMPRGGNSQALQEFCFGAEKLVCPKCQHSYGLPRKKKLALISGFEDMPDCELCPAEKVVFDNEGKFTGGPGVRMVLKHEDYLGLPLLRGHKIGKSGAPSLDKLTLEAYETILPLQSKQLAFVKSLQEKRKIDTAVTYLKGYKRFWQDTEHPGYHVLHGSANPTGTQTLRWSFSNPNSANVSAQSEHNLRYAFGPVPGREWYSMDGQNLELRIPSYEAGEKDAIYVFEHPNDPPYFGSYHLLVFDSIHPDKFREHGKKVKDLYASSLYSWIKSLNFAMIYGCQEETGDRAAHVVGAFKKVRHRFPKIAALADKQIAFANKYGYVTTIPDRKVDPDQGYPICCTRTEYGRILPTVPLNYHVQSTAMWWTSTAMVSCHNQLKEWQNEDGFDLYMPLQVHDELVFDTIKIDNDNLWRIAALKRLMEGSGDRIGVPTPVSVERHVDNWSEGEDITRELSDLQLTLAV
jgi:hypothetical protein